MSQKHRHFFPENIKMQAQWAIECFEKQTDYLSKKSIDVWVVFACFKIDIEIRIHQKQITVLFLQSQIKNLLACMCIIFVTNSKNFAVLCRHDDSNGSFQSQFCEKHGTLFNLICLITPMLRRLKTVKKLKIWNLWDFTCCLFATNLPFIDKFSSHFFQILSLSSGKCI